MNIVYAMTHHVYEQILPSMRSLKEHNPEARVFILAEHDELPFDLPMDAEIINVSGQKWFPEEGINYHNAFKYINLLKVRYPSILKVDRVIHLDTDTIVCDDLTPFWETNVEGKWFAACVERHGSYRPFGETYYNMGVALINLAQMRKDEIEQPMQNYLNGKWQPYADQDAWNKYAIEQDKAVALDVRWNESRPTGCTSHPGIVHYCGIKDWFTRFDMFRVNFLNQYRKE